MILSVDCRLIFLSDTPHTKKQSSILNNCPLTNVNHLLTKAFAVLHLQVIKMEDAQTYGLFLIIPSDFFL